MNIRKHKHPNGPLIEITLDSLQEVGGNWYRGASGSWVNYEERSTVEKLIRENGSEVYAKQAEEIIAKFKLPSLETHGVAVGPSMIGAPVIPAVLAGHPMACFGITEVEDERSPLTIWVNLTSSAGIAARDVAKRGALIYTLGYLLSAVRAVRIRAYAAIGGSKTTAAVAHVPIDSDPWSSAQAAFVLSSVGFVRGALYGKIIKHGAPGTQQGLWPFESSSLQVDQEIVALCGIESETLHVPRIFFNDPSVNEPVEWLRTQLAKYGVEI